MKISLNLQKLLIVTTLTAGTLEAPVFAADIPMKAPYPKTPALAVYDWTGVYFGLNAGVGLGRSFGQLITGPGGPVDSATSSYLGPFGVFGGGQIGYNWQMGYWVLGLEADIQGGNLRGNPTCSALCDPTNELIIFDQKLDWFGTLRGRIGLTTGPVLSYATGGFAYGKAATDITDNLGLGIFTGTGVGRLSETRTGWTIGGGVEASLGGNWTGKIEYLYLDLGTQSVAGGIPVSTISFDIRQNIFRAGLNYRIGGNGTYAAAPANWTGLYAGVNGGGSTARNQTRTTLVEVPNLPISFETFDLMPQGYIGGAQIGYNWQAANWVFGLEADIQGSTQKDDKSCQLICDGSVLLIDQRMPWFGTARGRVGYTVGSSLFYATGGLAYGGVKRHIREEFAGESFIGEFKDTKKGWTVGGGIETPLELFGKNWTAKTEYLHVDLGKTTDAYAFGGGGSLFNGTIETRLQEHIFRAGLNYHFNAPVPVVTRY